jgi:hypothetical protein
MEAQAPYSISPTPPPADLRDLVAPVAAWLAQQGFQVVCGPVAGSPFADVMGVRRTLKGEVFVVRLFAWAGWAMCECEMHLGTFTHTCFAWTLVESAQEVRWLLERNRQYRQASAAAGVPLGAVRGQGTPEA